MRKNASSQLTPDEAYSKASALCSQAEHCSTDIREKLTRWGIGPESADNIIAKLVREKYIDEARYSKAFAHDRLYYSNWGRIKIQANLRLLRIAGNHIHSALETLDEDQYQEILQKIIDTKRHSFGDLTDANTNTKIIRFALQRGFEMEEIMKHMKPFETI